MRKLLVFPALLLIAGCAAHTEPAPVAPPPPPVAAYVPPPAPPPVVETPGPTGPVYHKHYHRYAHKYHGHNVYYKSPAKSRHKRHPRPTSG